MGTFLICMSDRGADMEKSFTDLIEFGLRGNRIDNLVQGWTFQVAEVSSNVYKIDGEDDLGHHVQSYGVDPVTVLMLCIREAERTKPA